MRWKDIDVYDYEVSDTGIVRSKERYVFAGSDRLRKVKPRVIKQFKTNSGYMNVSLTNKHIKMSIHRLVAGAFVGSVRGKEVNHKDGGKENNSVSNLEVVTSSENKIHSYKVLGQKSWNIKLDKKKANEIRVIYKKGGISQKKLGDKYKVSTMVINRIINFKQNEYR